MKNPATPGTITEPRRSIAILRILLEKGSLSTVLIARALDSTVDPVRESLEVMRDIHAVREEPGGWALDLSLESMMAYRVYKGDGLTTDPCPAGPKGGTYLGYAVSLDEQVIGFGPTSHEA